MQVLSKCEARLLQEQITMVWVFSMCQLTYFSTAVFQQDVDVLIVLEMMIKVHNVFVV